ncbi:MAG: hypothetical protein QNK11_08375 [Legionella sp.]|nr:hypothetical protein [Legionella sp.]
MLTINGIRLRCLVHPAESYWQNSESYINQKSDQTHAKQFIAKNTSDEETHTLVRHNIRTFFSVDAFKHAEALDKKIVSANLLASTV